MNQLLKLSMSKVELIFMLMLIVLLIQVCLDFSFSSNTLAPCWSSKSISFPSSSPCHPFPWTLPLRDLSDLPVFLCTMPLTLGQDLVISCLNYCNGHMMMGPPRTLLPLSNPFSTPLQESFKNSFHHATLLFQMTPYSS